MMRRVVLMLMVDHQVVMMVVIRMMIYRQSAYMSKWRELTRWQSNDKFLELPLVLIPKV